MRKFIIITAIGLIACTANQKMFTVNTSLAKDTIIYPYKPYYSSSFEMGNPEHSKIILAMWKNWDNNNLDNSYQYLADTIQLYLPDGTNMKSDKKTVWEGVKMYRNNYQQIVSKAGAWLPFRSTDKNENWVAVWGQEYHTDKNGVRDSVNLHEIWMFDKNNKVKYLRQYDALFNMEQKPRAR